MLVLSLLSSSTRRAMIDRQSDDKSTMTIGVKDPTDRDVNTANSSDLESTENTSSEARPSNEYVLNFAFLSFLIFTSVQFFFASLAKSDAMMTDCAAMMVDVVTYLFNILAERLKHLRRDRHVEMSARDLRLRRLYLELVPPLLSVVTLIAVTLAALHKAVHVLFAEGRHNRNQSATASASTPDVYIMFIFSALNLLLDVLNVSCFARVDQAVGLPGQVTHQPHHHHEHDHEHGVHAAVASIPDEKDRQGSAGSTGVKQHSHAAHESTPLLDVARDVEALKDTKGKGGPVDSAALDETESEDSTDATGTLNLNMCSAWTHVCADTLRSVAVLIASAVASIFPHMLSARQADSGGAIVVSIIILISLVPLIQGLYLTACKIKDIWFGVSASADGQYHSHDLAQFYVT